MQHAKTNSKNAASKNVILLQLLHDVRVPGKEHAPVIVLGRRRENDARIVLRQDALPLGRRALRSPVETHPEIVRDRPASVVLRVHLGDADGRDLVRLDVLNERLEFVVAVVLERGAVALVARGVVSF